MLSVIMLIVIMLNVIMMNIVKLSVIMCVIMANVIMLNVVLLSVLAPVQQCEDARVTKKIKFSFEKKTKKKYFHQKFKFVASLLKRFFALLKAPDRQG